MGARDRGSETAGMYPHRIRQRTAAIVIGAGPAGLAAAAALRRHGIAATVLERGDSVGTAWRGRYDRLRLNTSRLTSRLPGQRYPRGTGLFPTRDEFVAGLERFAERHALDIRPGTQVEAIEHVARGWCVCTSAGALPAVDVIVATGYAGTPAMPSWPGHERFAGKLLHSSEYRNAAPFRDRDVLVVGAGSSGMEIAYDLAEGGAARVRVAVRTPPNIVLRAVGGLPGDPAALALQRLPPGFADAQGRVLRRLLLGDLSRYGLPVPAEGPFARLRRLGVAPAIVDAEVIGAIRQGRIEIVAGVDALATRGVVLTDGTRIEPHAVVAATGYRCGLEPLVGQLGVLGPRGMPVAAGGHEAAPGLRFVGYVPVPDQIRRMGFEARRAAAGIARRRGGEHLNRASLRCDARKGARLA